MWEKFIPDTTCECDIAGAYRSFLLMDLQSEMTVPLPTEAIIGLVSGPDKKSEPLLRYITNLNWKHCSHFNLKFITNCGSLRSLIALTVWSNLFWVKYCERTSFFLTNTRRILKFNTRQKFGRSSTDIDKVLLKHWCCLFVAHEIECDRLSDQISSGVAHFASKLIGYVNYWEIFQLCICHQENAILDWT